MAHWKEAAVTNDGVEMLNEWMAGRKLTITAAYGGTGTVDPEQLTEQTGLVNLRQKLSLMGRDDDKTGVLVQVQVNNMGVTVEYELNQVAVYAALDRDKDPDSPEKPLFIMQDQKGVDVPAEDDEVFLLELYCAIGITNNGRFIVTVDTTGLVSMGRMREAIEAAILAHNEDPDAHGGHIGPGGTSVQRVEITIPAEGWEPNTDPVEEAGLLHVDVTCEDVRESMIPYLSVAPVDRKKAKVCGMNNQPRTLDGIIRVYAVVVPAESMEADVALLGSGGGSGGSGGEYVLPAASETRLGGAKIGAAGTGLKMSPDGTASVNWEDMDAAATAAVAAKAAEKIIPSEEDIDQMLDENFQPYTPGQ